LTKDDPLKIGVTGHQEREGIEWPWVRSKVDRYLTGKVQLVGYSSLAAGTDQLFADAVLERGGKLIAVVPISDYASHFEGDSLKHYRKLLTASEVIELKSTKQDSRAFLDAGKWVAREAERLIAVWDGEPAEGAGGTGDIVAYALSLGRPVHHIDPIKQIVSDL
jgi:hypothetical protein